MKHILLLLTLAALLSGCAATGKVKLGRQVTAPDPFNSHYLWHGPVHEVIIKSYEQRRTDDKLSKKRQESNVYIYRFNSAGQIMEIASISEGKYYGGKLWTYDEFGRIALYRALNSDSAEYFRREWSYKTETDIGKAVPGMPPVERTDDNETVLRDSLGRPSVITVNDKWGHKQKSTTNRYNEYDRLIGNTIETFKRDEWVTRDIFTYDGYGRPATHEQWGRGSDGRPWSWVYRYEYDWQGNKIVQEVRDLQGKFIDRMTWQYRYDRYGNSVQIVKDQGNAIYTTQFKIRFYR